MAVLKSLRPFMEASLALFSAGAPPQVVADKFSQVVSRSTVYRWYHSWAELKGIPVERRYRARKKADPRVTYEYEKQMRDIIRDKKRRKEERLQRIREQRAEMQKNKKQIAQEILTMHQVKRQDQ